jgi:hypothetical protein
MRSAQVLGLCYYEGDWEPLMMSAESRRRCEEVLDGFELPFPLTLESLAEAAQAFHDRPIILHRDEFPASIERPCGLWWRDSEGDHIWVSPAFKGSQEVHAFAHELGHVFLEHPPVPLGTAEEAAEPEEETFKWLSPAFLNGTLLGVRARAHSAHRDPEYIAKEGEAEGFASLLRRKAAFQARDRHSDPLLNKLSNSI